MLCEEAHGQHRGVDDANALLLEIRDDVNQRGIIQAVVAIGENNINCTFWYPVTWHFRVNPPISRTCFPACCFKLLILDLTAFWGINVLVAKRGLNVCSK